MIESFELNILTALVFFFLLFFKKEKYGYCSKIMAAVMLMFVLMSLRFMEPDMLTDKNWKMESYGDLLFRFGALMSNSLLAVYFIVLSTTRVKRWQWWAIFGPPLLVWLLIVVIYSLTDEVDLKNYIFCKVLHTVAMPAKASVKMLDFVASECYLFLRRFFCVILMLYSIYKLMIYHRNLELYFTDKRGKSLFWNYLSLVVFLIFVILLTIPNFDQSIVNLQQSSMSYKLCIAVWSEAYIFLFGLAAWRTNYPAAQFVAETGSYEMLDMKLRNKGPKVKLKNEIAVERLWNDAMYNNKMYLQPTLTLDDVAREMHTDRMTLLQLLNIKYDMPFYRIAQHFRIQHAKELLEGRPNYAMDELAKKCGFATTKLFIQTYKSLENKDPRKLTKVNSLGVGKKNVTFPANDVTTKVKK